MVDLAQVTGRRGKHPAAVAAFVLIASLLVVPVTATALAAGFGLLPLPFELFRVLQRLPTVFPLHMIASGLALILIPIAALARHRRRLHRAAGRAAAICVAIGGTTALLVALASEATLPARAGFFTQGVVWLTLLGAAVVAVRRRNIIRHARLMIAMGAVASGAIWLRLSIYAATSAGLPFDPAYAVTSWACWLVPLALVGLLVLQKEKRPSFSPGRLSSQLPA
jgi:hypothetical protein